MGAALDWVSKEYDGLIQETESTAATAAASALMLKNDPDALAVTFVNFGGFDIFLALAQNAPANSGIRLTANGGSASLNVRDDGTLPAREWYAASPGGASSLYALRLRRDVRAG
jgi:hypothetical protein